MEEPQSEVDSYCQHSDDDDDKGNHDCPDVEAWAESEESESDIVVICQGCGYEVCISRLSCSVCGRERTGFEHRAGSEQEPQQESISSENSVSASSTTNGCARRRRVIYLPLSDSSHIEQGTISEVQVEQNTGNAWIYFLGSTPGCNWEACLFSAAGHAIHPWAGGHEALYPVRFDELCMMLAPCQL